MMSQLMLSISPFFLLASINASMGCRLQLQNLFYNYKQLLTSINKYSLLNGIEIKNLYRYECTYCPMQNHQNSEAESLPESLEQVFFCEFCEISRNTFFYRTPPVTASENY